MCIPYSGATLDTLRYFLSADAQSMAAFFAVGGIFAIFRLQSIDAQLNSASQSYREFYKRHGGKGTIRNDQGKYIDTYDSKEANEWLDKDLFYIILQHYNNNKGNVGILDYCFYLKKLTDAKVKIVKGLRWPTFFIILCFILSILGLYFVDLIYSYSSFKALAMVLLLTLNAIAVLLMVYYIWLCFNLPNIINFNNSFAAINFKELRAETIKIIEKEINEHCQAKLNELKSDLIKLTKKS